MCYMPYHYKTLELRDKYAYPPLLSSNNTLNVLYMLSVFFCIYRVCYFAVCGFRPPGGMPLKVCHRKS